MAQNSSPKNWLEGETPMTRPLRENFDKGWIEPTDQGLTPPNPNAGWSPHGNLSGQTPPIRRGGPDSR